MTLGGLSKEADLFIIPIFKMRVPLLRCVLFLCAAGAGLAASSWGFDDATVSVQGKGSGIGGGLKEKWVSAECAEVSWKLNVVHYRITEGKALSKPLSLGASDNLKILLTTSENKKAKRPHQAFLNLRDPKSDLETSLAFQVKENGKAKIDLVSTMSSPGYRR